jgi:NADH dehydrogenase/NADH:ubiquinone oxidoreductase subunit G
VRSGGQLVETDWADAMAFVARRLAEQNGKDVGIAIRADATLEEGAAVRALADHLGTGQLDHAPRPAGGVIAPGGQARLEELATADAILVVGDVTEEVPIVDLRIKDALKGVTPPDLFDHGAPIADLRLKERMPLEGGASPSRRRTGSTSCGTPARAPSTRPAARRRSSPRSPTSPRAPRPTRPRWACPATPPAA